MNNLTKIVSHLYLTLFIIGELTIFSILSVTFSVKLTIVCKLNIVNHAVKGVFEGRIIVIRILA